MLWDLARIKNIELIDSFYVHGIVFPYEFLQLPLPSVDVMHALLNVLFISALFITLGLFYRVAMIVFAVGFSYFFFLDQVLYNNHLYLICLLSFLMIFMPADAAFSVSKRRARVEIPQWPYRILQFQLILVFFFGGLVKLNPYWLNFHPVEELLQLAAQRTGNNFLMDDWVKYLFTYGGLLFDLLIGPLLLIKRTRPYAMIAAILFNLTNSYIFNDIFIFPFFMIGAMLVFMDPDRVFERLKKWGIVKEKNTEAQVKQIGKLGAALLAGYVVVQLAVPLRHYFIPGYTDWTGEGQRFSWRMKIQHRNVEEMVFAIMDLDTKVIHEINPNDHLFPDEVQQMTYSPQMILQFAQYLHDTIAPLNGVNNCWVKAKVKVSFNGKEAAYIFKPTLNLIEAAQSGKAVRTFMEPEPK